MNSSVQSTTTEAESLGKETLVTHFLDLFACLEEVMDNVPNQSLFLAIKDLYYDTHGRIANYFNESPQLRIDISDQIQSRRLSRIDWSLLQPEVEGLALLYNFSPFQDTGATVASKRIRNFGKTVDVIACSMLHRKKIDPTIETISQPYVRKKKFLSTAPSWDSFPKYESYVRRAIREAEMLMQEGAKYKFIYSRAMWAPSLYAGAMFKIKHPEIKWIAEFSDPLSRDVEGKRRGAALPQDSLLLAEFAKRIELPKEQISEFNVFELAEYLVYILADEIVFTNTNQKNIMLDQIYESDFGRNLFDEVEKKSSVQNHPTLPREYYSVVDSDYKVSDQFLNLAYFGEFYSSRGITEVTAAIRSLPDCIRKRIKLHVFTNYIPPSEGGARPRQLSEAQFNELVERAHEGVGSKGIEENVSFNASLPYLKFLATTDRFDVLIVNDARSGEHHKINPYLPSKWSDYAGSSASSWAFIEAGSILSTKNAKYKTPVGDVLTARKLLWDLVLEKYPETVV
ncbi:hypothetical protein CEPID_00700 [Corynebacterium epidermidicanis]|uniref:Uncharacterized protein n=1 Tax=Corynebacterium epidermidicanis TaxID=1050174 RepID=A0A0G3GLI8_9CORY|nr:hypothetical protein CEPID_00700 [Corynebacterium epidermidicanis]